MITEFLSADALIYQEKEIINENICEKYGL